jgi:hypothetical protein
LQVAVPQLILKKTIMLILPVTKALPGSIRMGRGEMTGTKTMI